MARRLGRPVDVVRSCYDCVYLRRGDAARGDKLVVRTGEGVEIVLRDEFRYCVRAGKAWVRGPTPSQAEVEAEHCEFFTRDWGLADHEARAQGRDKAPVVGAVPR